MFNGIKSILFGYSTEEQTETNSSNVDTNNTADNRSSASRQISRESSIISSSSSFSHDTSALLEQTLNAATTKLTEQLLPRCPSIEQLQSSSHQLLPTLNEQHEEDELKRRKINEVIGANNNNSNNNAEDADDDDDDDDDDGFNADSWELLDLVEKQPTTAEASLTGKQVKDNSSKTSGILKSSKTTSTVSSSNSQNNNNNIKSVAGIQQKRQNKPKVSFETPDLVKETKEKIERITTPKEKDVKLGDQKQEKKEEKKKKKVDLKKNKKFGGNIDDDKSSIDLFCCELFPEIATDENIEKVVELKEKVEVNQLESSCKVLKPQPVLNYAAALSMKLNKKTQADGSSKNLKQGDVKTLASSSSKSNNKNNVKGSLQASGAVKRNRPVSFSSSSCENDDDEDLEITWNNVIEPEGPIDDIDGKCKKWQIDDDGNDSIVSSGFSDCDFGYEGLNDIIMRPKKASSKKRRGLSSSHRASIKKRDPINVGGEAIVAAKNKTLAANGSSSATIPERKSSLGIAGKENPKPLISVSSSSSKNNIKPKKKKLILSSTTSSYEFMKKRSPFNDGEQPTTGFKLVGKSSSETQNVESKSTTCKPISASHLMPPPPQSSSMVGTTLQTGSNTNSGNDSSDIADMDESWYVTPPPCFTGSNRFMKSSKVAKFSKAKEADRENALIEHPSIYIASTSKQQQPSVHEKQMQASDRDVLKNKNKEPANSTLKENNSLLLTNKQKPIVLRKVGKVAANSSSSDSDNKKKVAHSSTTATTNKSLALKHQSSQNLYKKGVVKAWENKFIVTNWSHDDEQEDVNEDFDNMFDDIENKCSSSKNHSLKVKKSKTKVQSNKRKEEIELQSLGRSFSPEISPGYESDEFSIPSPALMNDIEVSSSDMSLGEVVPSPNSLVLISNNSASSGDENVMLERQQQSEIVVKRRNHHELVGSVEKKAPTQVRPIEPERRPGWQLRRKRSRRRPLSASMSNTCNAASGGVKLTSVKPLTSKQQMMSTNNSSTDASRSASRSGCSNLSSTCSSPTLIDHMSSIVANLTSGFTAGASSLPFQSRSTIDVECMEKSNHGTVSLSPPHSEQSNLDSVSRRRMSKSYLDRQNNCSKLGNINRRADRRTKMRTTPNGYSINRKVHTNFH